MPRFSAGLHSTCRGRAFRPSSPTTSSSPSGRPPSATRFPPSSRRSRSCRGTGAGCGSCARSNPNLASGSTSTARACGRFRSRQTRCFRTSITSFLRTPSCPPTGRRSSPTHGSALRSRSSPGRPTSRAGSRPTASCRSISTIRRRQSRRSYGPWMRTCTTGGSTPSRRPVRACCAMSGFVRSSPAYRRPPERCAAPGHPRDRGAAAGGAEP